VLPAGTQRVPAAADSRRDRHRCGEPPCPRSRRVQQSGQAGGSAPPQRCHRHPPGHGVTRGPGFANPCGSLCGVRSGCP